MGVKVNGQMVPLKYILKNGDIVEVLTQSSRTPSRDWLKIVTTSRAKNKIRHWFRTHLSADEVDKGKHLLEREAVRLGVDLNEAIKSGMLESMVSAFGCHNANELYANIGHGEISAKGLLNKITAKIQEAHPEKIEKIEKLEDRKPELRPLRSLAAEPIQNIPMEKGISIAGKTDWLIRFARCCTPVPGDPIVGYITRGRGVSVHRTDCPNTLLLPDGSNRMIKVSWEANEGQVFEVAVEVKARDREKLLADMLLAISAENVIINEASAKIVEGGWAQGYFVLGITSTDQLQKALKKLERVPGVVSARRIEPR
jgi:GTP pyrophosphokinase